MSHILVIRNVFNGEILTWNGSSVTTHGQQYTNSANNFCAKVLGENDQYHIERYNDESDKLQPAIGGPENCHQAIPVSSTATVWIAEPAESSGDSLSGIKLFTTNSSGNKWYLRVPAFNSGGEQPDLVCPDHNNHADYFEQELLFDLISVDVNTIS